MRRGATRSKNKVRWALNVLASMVVAGNIFTGCVLLASGCGPSKGAIKAHDYLHYNIRGWTCLVTGGTSKTGDTLSIKIKKTIFGQGGRREQEIRTTNKGQETTGGAVTSGDKISFFIARSSSPTFSILFPLEVGTRWEEPNVARYVVEAIDTVVTYEPRVRCAYRIRMTSDIPKDSSSKRYWIDPTVGLIRMREVRIQPYS